MFTEDNNIGFKISGAEYNVCTTRADGWDHAQCYTMSEHLHDAKGDWNGCNVHTENTRGILVWKSRWVSIVHERMQDNYMMHTDGRCSWAAVW